MRFSKATLTTWTSIVESTVWGRPTPGGRSAMLLWHIARYDIHPEFVMVLTVLRMEWRRLCYEPLRPRGPMVDRALHVLGWRLEGAVWSTRTGSFTAAEMSGPSFTAEVKEAYEQVLWLNDTKTALPLPDRTYYDFSAHRSFGGGPTFRHLRTAGAAAVDGFKLQRTGKDCTCSCGLANPSRHHLSFECPSNPWTLGRKSEQEERLLAACVVAPPKPEGAPYDEEAVQKVARYIAEAEFPLLATDGGALLVPGMLSWRVATWAVVADNRVIASGRVPGREQTSAAAERFALLVVAKATAAAAKGTAVRVVCDCQALVQRCLGLRACGQGRRGLAEFEEAICAALTALQLEWVPSHGKRRDWSFSKDWCTSDAARSLNATADAECSRQLRCFTEWIAGLKAQRAQAVQWSLAALKRQHNVTAGYDEQLRKHMAEKRRVREVQGGENP